jgi:hypothetical protein
MYGYCPICQKHVGAIGYVGLTESEFLEAQQNGVEVKFMHTTDSEGDHEWTARREALTESPAR